MATAVAFDTLKLARKLEAAGFEHQQAADVSEAMAEAFAIAEVATKADIERLAAANKADIREAQAATMAAIREAQAATMAAISEVKTATMAAIAEVKTALRESEHRQAAENVAMRSALRESEQRQIAENATMRAEMKAENTTMRAEAKALELRMTIKLGSLIAAGVAVLAAMKFFGH